MIYRQELLIQDGDIEKAEHLYKEAMKHGYYNEDLVTNLNYIKTRGN